MTVIVPTTVRSVVKGWRRQISILLGLFFVGMAYLGAIIPGLPATPFVLLASYFFSRSSPRLQRWLQRTPYFGHLLHDWENHRGLRRPVKWMATCIMLPVVSVSIFFTPLPLWVKIVIGALACCGLVTIWAILPTVRLPLFDKGAIRTKGINSDMPAEASSVTGQVTK